MGKGVWADDTTKAENVPSCWPQDALRNGRRRWCCPQEALSLHSNGDLGSGLKQLPPLSGWRRRRTVALSTRRFNRQWLRAGPFHWCLKPMS